jgi:putative transposase
MVRQKTQASSFTNVKVFEVDPKNTSRTCNACGHTSKDNRRTQEEFICVSCGNIDNADYNAAKNICEKDCV